VADTVNLPPSSPPPTPPTSPRVVSEPFGQKGIRRYIFPALTSCSLVLMVLSLGMWARSHYVRDFFECTHDGREWFVSSVYGRFFLTWTETGGPDEPWNYGQASMQLPIRDLWSDSVWKRVGIQWGEGSVRHPEEPGGWLRIRWPFIAGVATILPIARVIRDRRRKRLIERLKQGLCPRCGYDIRSSPTCCPECGFEPIEALK
jgi:hypothetical protein